MLKDIIKANNIDKNYANKILKIILDNISSADTIKNKFNKYKEIMITLESISENIKSLKSFN